MLLDDFFRPSILLVKFIWDAFEQNLHFLRLFFFELVNKLQSCILIVAHVLIPGVGELNILLLLCRLDGDELPLLCHLHVVFLASHLLGSPVFKNMLQIICVHVIIFLFTLFLDMVGDF